MIKKLALALATFGLVLPSPTLADTRAQVRIESPDVSVRIGNTDRYRYDRDRYYRGYYNRHYQHRRYPRCGYGEVAVRNPYRYNRYVCVDRREFRNHDRDYRRGY